ncbi:MAG: flagellar basal body rod protein FlgB [Burkholderiaceae bacterium]|jgi:flagellar basal-body rod protein FlgB|nr:flagellar basal body rod protein FlgB [Burkholderiaceae bacterium]MEB2317799.1 flagellar basal body rod protein FlgB [Pseudomonadota bacterium]
MSNPFTGMIEFHSQALALRAERQKVLASNIANADTPGFQARDFDFQAALKAATGPQANRPASVVSTSPGHLPIAHRGVDGSLTLSTLSWRKPEQPSADGNTVDMDRERANFADNALRYEAALRFINSNVRTMVSAIRGE